MTDNNNILALPLDEQLLRLEQAKEEGNRLFGQQSFDDSLTVYLQAVQSYVEADQQEAERRTAVAVRRDSEAKSSEDAAEAEEGEAEKPVESEVELKIKTVRSQIHSNAAAVYKQQGLHEEAVEQSSLAIRLDPSYTKALLRRGASYEALGQARNALADYKQVLELKEKCTSEMLLTAAAGQARVGPAAAAEEQRQLEELKSTLGGLANKFLGLFGMSTDNFQMVQDPATGGYSVNIKQ